MCACGCSAQGARSWPTRASSGQISRAPTPVLSPQRQCQLPGVPVGQRVRRTWGGRGWLGFRTVSDNPCVEEGHPKPLYHEPHPFSSSSRTFCQVSKDSRRSGGSRASGRSAGSRGSSGSGRRVALQPFDPTAYEVSAPACTPPCTSLHKQCQSPLLSPTSGVLSVAEISVCVPHKSGRGRHLGVCPFALCLSLHCPVRCVLTFLLFVPQRQRRQRIAERAAAAAMPRPRSASPGTGGQPRTSPDANHAHQLSNLRPILSLLPGTILSLLSGNVS